MKRKLIIRTLILLIAGLYIPMAFAARPAKASKGRVVEGRIPSSILAGDSARPYYVYLPPSYDKEPDRTFPVLYLLHGGFGDYTDWVAQGHVDQTADSLINAGKMKEMVIVMPDGRYRDNTMWLNMQGHRGEDNFFSELIPYIESTYRAGGAPSRRAIAGLSLGGDASVVYSVNHPDDFCALYAMSSYLFPVDSFINPATEWLEMPVAVNAPYKKILNADDASLAKLKKLHWFIDCGDKDFTYDSNIRLIDALRTRRIPYEFRVRSGGHEWPYWQSALQLMFPFLSDIFSKCAV